MKLIASHYYLMRSIIHNLRITTSTNWQYIYCKMLWVANSKKPKHLETIFLRCRNGFLCPFIAVNIVLRDNCGKNNVLIEINKLKKLQLKMWCHNAATFSIVITRFERKLYSIINRMTTAIECSWVLKVLCIYVHLYLIVA